MYEFISQILTTELGIEANLINPDTFLKKDLELDSTETVIIALEIKKQLDVDFRFTEKDISISEICNQIEQLKKENNK